MLEKILLCSNGINIEFNTKFNFKEFIEILKNEEKLMEEIDYTFANHYHEQKWRNFSLDFIKIVKNCRKSLDSLSEEAKNNGIEVAIFTFLKSVDTLMRVLGIENNIEKYNKFEEFFKLLFFSYLFRNGLTHYSLMIKSDFINGFKNVLENYRAIYTLNYDIFLEKFIANKELLFYLHGKILIDDNGINYKNCYLESYRNPKEKQPLPLIASVIDRNNLKGRFELDIVGINPINDENIFALFINSQICNKINFYYHNENDLKNLDMVLDKIKNWEVINNISKDNKKVNLKVVDAWTILEYKLEKTAKKYIVTVYDDSGKAPYMNTKSSISLEINLFQSNDFWEKCGKKINSSRPVGVLNKEINII